MEVDIECDFGTDDREFEHYVGRKPKDQAELERFAYLMKKGMVAQLDWDMIASCAADNL